MPLIPNTRLGPYEILAPLGAGGMGEVYRARDTRLDREVAIKVLPAHLSMNPESRVRFEREAKAVAALSHPHILAVYDVGHHDGVAYVVTELLEGETLRQTLQDGALGRRRALEIAIAIADGLAAAHARGIVHRDLKPENIFLTNDGVVKILDFGLARLEEPPSAAQHSAHTPTVTLYTTPGTVIGTVNYMSPEQIRAQRTDARSDVFSFGCVLHEMLTGERAFQGETSADTMTAILREPPKSVRSKRQDIGPDVERVIERCLEKKPETRFQSSHDLAFTLRSILADSGSATAREALSPARPSRWMVGWALPVIALALLGLWLWWRQSSTGNVAAAAPVRSIVVLPFVNQSGNPGDEYFSDGMTDELASALMKVPGLRVAARSSAFSFKGKNADAREVGAKLDVSTVLEGAVRRSDARLRITAQLVNTADGLVRWSERYEREAKDVFAVQDEITAAIVSALQLTLGSASTTAANVRTDNSEAHDLYLRGRFLAFKQTEEGLRRGLEYFEKSLEKDPNYAPAYAGMSFAHGYLADAFAPPNEAQPKAKAAALKALELDETNAEAHTYLALIRWFYEWEFENVDAGFRRAIQLSPNSMEAHNFYAVALCGMGRFDEGLAAVGRAITLDPLSAVPSWTREYCLVMARRYDEAIAQHQRTVELDPAFFYVDSKAAMAYRAKGMFAESVAEYERLRQVLGDLPLHGLAISHAKMGKTAEATKILQEFLDLSQRQYVSPEQIALIYAALGDTDQAFAWLDRAYDSRSAFMVSQILRSPDYDGLRSDPRFDDLLRRIGLSRFAIRSIGSSGRATPAERKATLAVLPFANDSRDAELDYLSDGIAETLINAFSRLEAMNTVPRSTAFRHKKDDADPVDIGRQLSATAILTGRVLKRGDNLTIQAELIDVTAGRQLWGERYQRKAADLVEIERDIARDITDALRLRLTGEEKQSLSRGYSQDSEAYRLYLQGRHWWAKRTREGFDHALRMFQEAVRLDESFALAFSGLADCYSLLPLYGWMIPKEAEAFARTAAEKALRLDDGLAEAHTSMGMVWFYLNWQFDKAEEEFRRAEQLNPRYATTQQWWGLCVGARGQFAEARQRLRRAIELDPLTPIFTHNLAWGQMWKHDWSASLATAQSGLEFAPEFFLFHQSIGLTQVELGNEVEAIAALRRAREIAGPVAFANSYLAYGLGRTGNKDECRAILDEWLALQESRYVPPTDFALMYVALGDHDKAIEWLEKGYEQRDVWMSFLAVLPFWDPLRDDPRLTALLRRIGLPDLRAESSP